MLPARCTPPTIISSIRSNYRKNSFDNACVYVALLLMRMIRIISRRPANTCMIISMEKQAMPRRSRQDREVDRHKVIRRTPRRTSHSALTMMNTISIIRESNCPKHIECGSSISAIRWANEETTNQRREAIWPSPHITNVRIPISCKRTTRN